MPSLAIGMGGIDSKGGGGGSWRAAPPRAPRPDDGNPTSQKRVFSATGTQGRRAAMRPGIFDEVDRSKHANINPTSTASTAGLRGALGVGAMGEAAAKAVIGRMMRNRRNRQGGHRSSTRVERKSTGNIARNTKGRPQPDGVRQRVVSPARVKKGGSPQHRTAITAAGGRLEGNVVAGGNLGALGVGRRGRGRGGARGGGRGGAASGFDDGVFKAVLSSMANDRLRSGLQEIKTNPRDLLRCEFVDIEPSRHGSTALGCHLMKGLVAQKAGNQRRVSHYTAQCHTSVQRAAKTVNRTVSVTWLMRT